MLKLQDAEIFYGQMEVIKKVSLEVKQGELVSVIGANGAGKSTLIKAMMGLVKIKHGKLFYEGEDITDYPAWKRAELGIGYVPEGRRIFGDLSVEENLKMGAYKIKDKAQIKRNLEKAYDMFPKLSERRNQLARTMSGGEQQILAISRALILEPRLLLIDEVSMGLMPIMVNYCFSLIKELNQQGITVLVVEQNANKVLKIADRGYLIETGQIMVEGTAESLRQNDVVLKAYLGE
ncbi:ABC transporter ATP-binding protein [Acidaminobacter sp.]|uniref:ABC transporter ATP-binding protein n=1 Tax=Acidaminobacter sp. TaxID=1872102 RepID=UPI00137DAEC2|nr:ATP-binding cassette domain-containing protein [Acidaminobacter sp.]